MVKIKDKSKKNECIDIFEVTKALGTRMINVPELTKKESKNYELLGSPVATSEANGLIVYHFGYCMLRDYGHSLDDVVGYRILDIDEELEFRKEVKIPNAFIVQYYGEKIEEK